MSTPLTSAESEWLRALATGVSVSVDEAEKSEVAMVLIARGLLEVTTSGKHGKLIISSSGISLLNQIISHDRQQTEAWLKEFVRLHEQRD